MDHASFVADPKGYLQAHTVEVGHRDARQGTAWITVGNVQAAANGGRPSCQFTHLRTLKCEFNPMGPGPVDAFKKGWVRGVVIDPNVGKEYGPKAGLVAAGRSIQVGHKRVLRVVDDGGLQAPDNGFRCLPFTENHVNYMELDAASTFALTGPLSGCTIAVGRGTGGRLWFFHANENNANGYQARQSQRLSILGVIASLGIPQTQLFFCRNGDRYFGYSGMGFVWGRARGGGAWKFYSHYEDANGRFNLKWADI